MALPAHVHATACVLLSLLCLPGTVLAQEDSGSSHDCGLEPPGATYVPLPGPRPHETRWSPSEPPLVRREEVSSGVRALSGLPQTRVRTGALSGKTIYLSPGHGFYRSSPLGRWATQRGNTNDVIEDLVSIETLNQYLLPMLMGAGATVVPVRESDLNPRMVILNNGGAGYSEEGAAGLFSTSTLAGWGPPPVPMGNAVEPFKLGGNRLMTAAPTATASATWAPTVPADGYYHVYVSYSAYSARVPDAHYVVRHAGGESHFRVNQRRHGGTWVLLGRFYFRAGLHPETASVVALNDSTASGNVSLDAVRFGGGSGAIGDGTLAALPRPRFEECARYHTQFSGAPPAVFAPSGVNALSNERNDDVSARPRFASWLHEDGEDAVYVAWHTNASGLSKPDDRFRGTEVYVYGPNPVDGTLNFTGVTGSDVLGRKLREELMQDIRNAVEPTWQMRPLRSANFGEVNPAHNPEMPSVLLELAYHDHPADAVFLKRPEFRRVAARAILQGLIKYFATRDSKDPLLPPEPPTALVARNAAGKVEVRWAEPPTDTLDLGGHKADGYRVYQSADGLAWDEGSESTGTTFSVTLSPGTTRYFRVASVNAGGESFPSEVVGVRVPESGKVPEVLVVNAFRRLDENLARQENLSAYALGEPWRQLLESMNDGTALRRHGDAVAQHGVAFDGATSEAIAAGLFTPVGYRVLDWFMGRGGAGGLGPTTGDQDLMRTFVTGGGHLLLSGSHVASALTVGGTADQAFLADILQVSLGGGASTLSVDGLTDGWLNGLSGAVLDDGTRGAFPVGTMDALTPLAGATPVLGYTGTSQSAGVASSAGGQVLFLGLPFEGLISPSRRAWLMGAFLARTGVLASAPPPPTGGDPQPPNPGTPNQWEASTKADPAPPPPPEPPPPAPYEVDRIPGTYENVNTGCGCRAGGGSASVACLLLVLTVQLRRTRRR